MKKVFTYFSSFLLISFSLLPLLTFAQIGTGNIGFTPSISNPLNVQSIEELFQKILELVVYLGTPVLVLIFIFLGFRFVTAKGDSGTLARLKVEFFWTLIGAAIILGAWAIAEALKNTVEQLGVTAFHYEQDL